MQILFSIYSLPLYPSWALILHYGQLYGARVVLLVILSIVTIFRREISCNRVYNGKEEDDASLSSSEDTHPQIMQNQHYYSPLERWITHELFQKSKRTLYQKFLPKAFFNKVDDPNKKMGLKELTTLSRIRISQRNERKEYYHPTCLHLFHLPQDLHIHILTFLHPRDILQFSTCSTKTYTMIHNEGSCEEKNQRRQQQQQQQQSSYDCSMASRLWFTLWKRDYACVLKDWDVGQLAVRRSLSFLKSRCTYCPLLVAAYLGLPMDPSFSSSSTQPPFLEIFHRSRSSIKDFYFYFGQTWINYTIAGHCTLDSCLIGLHGHVFNLVDFIASHPGSSETLLMLGGGRDATKIFESLGHSSTARKVATQQLLVVQDGSCMEKSVSSSSTSCHSMNPWGLCLYPKGDKDRSSALPPSKSMTYFTTPVRVSVATSLDTIASRRASSRSQPRKPGCTWLYKNKIHVEEMRALSKANSYWMGKEEQSGMVGPIQIYFDPICDAWMGWYIDSNFVPVFIGMLR